MSKKSFKDSNPAMPYISGSTDRDKEDIESNSPIETHKDQQVQYEHDTQQVQDVQKKHPTQGRKGQKLQRINMAFSDENIEYLRIISRAKGVSMTQYVNDLLDTDRGNNVDTINKLKELFDM